MQTQIRRAGAPMNDFPTGIMSGRSRTRQRLALALIIKNEGKYALQMIKSVLPVIGYISCVDTGSSDGSVELLQIYLDLFRIPHRIEQTAFSTFDAVRNIAIENVPGEFDWILMLDADEVIVEADLDKIGGLLEQEEFDAWVLPRFNWIDRPFGTRTDAYPDFQGRLFRNNRRIRYRGRVHETLTGVETFGRVEPLGIGAGGHAETLHIHHLKLIEKPKEELAEREALYAHLQGSDVTPACSDLRADCLAKLWDGHDPFGDAQALHGREDFQGWRSDHPYLREAIEETGPGVIVEVGVWKGGSTMVMADHLRQRGLAGLVIAVDTWLGASDHWLQPQWRESLRFEGGYPTLFRTFMANVAARSLQERVIPLPLDSTNAATVLKAREIRPTIVHIDAGHDYDSVMTDLRVWWPLLLPGGILIGDDYEAEGGNWPEVRRAFNDFFQVDEVENRDGKCRIRKS